MNPTRAQLALLTRQVVASALAQANDALEANAHQLEEALGLLLTERDELQARVECLLGMLAESHEAIRVAEREDDEERRRGMLEGEESPF